MSPFDKRISSLSYPQIAWVLSNHYKDQEEEFTKLKYILYFINPEAADKLFGEDTEKETFTEADDDEFLQEIQKHTGKNVSLKDLNDAMEHPEKLPSIEDLDIIEKID